MARPQRTEQADPGPDEEPRGPYYIPWPDGEGAYLVLDFYSRCPVAGRFATPEEALAEADRRNAHRPREGP